jgi:hypothetical protein
MDSQTAQNSQAETPRINKKKITDLPQEMRDAIYTEVLTGENPRKVWVAIIDPEAQTAFIRPYPEQSGICGLWMMCKQSQTDVEDLLFGATGFFNAQAIHGMYIFLNPGGYLGPAIQAPFDIVMEAISNVRILSITGYTITCAPTGPYAVYEPGDLVVRHHTDGDYRVGWTKHAVFDDSQYQIEYPAYLGESPHPWKASSLVNEYIHEVPDRVEAVLVEEGMCETALKRISKIINRERGWKYFHETDIEEELERLAQLYTLVPELGDVDDEVGQ